MPFFAVYGYWINTQKRKEDLRAGGYFLIFRLYIAKGVR
jgi:hypothetical protein